MFQKHGIDGLERFQANTKWTPAIIIMAWELCESQSASFERLAELTGRKISTVKASMQILKRYLKAVGISIAHSKKKRAWVVDDENRILLHQHLTRFD